MYRIESVNGARIESRNICYGGELTITQLVTLKQEGLASETPDLIIIEAGTLDLLDRRLREHNVSHEDVTSQEDVEFRLIHYNPALFHLPYFIKYEFPERAGALHDFLIKVRNLANICYFNYVFTGEEECLTTEPSDLANIPLPLN